MPARRGVESSCAIFGNHAIVAQANTPHGAWTQCSLSLKFDRARCQGMVGLRLMAHFNEVNARHITLQLPPEVFQQLEAGFNPEEIPISVKQHLNHNFEFRSYDQILILSLALSAPGRLITPQDATILTPINEHQTRVQNFQSLCQSTQLIFYIPTSTLSETRRSALDQFIELGATGKLASIQTDLRRAQLGRGGRESTWEIFNLPDPPSYDSQTGRATAKRIREESPISQTGASPKRLAAESQAASRGPPAYVCNSDSDTDFSRLLSPLRPSHIAKSPHSGSAQPTATAYDTPLGTLLQEALRAELNATLLGLLREMLPDVLREMLPELVRACLRDLLPGALNDLLFPVSPSSQDSEKSSSDFFVDRVVEPVVVRHLPQVVRTYIELEDPLEDYMGAADVEIKEASYNAVLEIKEAKDESVAEIKQAETDVVERLTGVDWNVIGKEIMGLTPSQQSYSQRSSGGAATAAVRQNALNQEGGREELEDQEPGEHPLMEDRIYTSEAQGSNRLLSRTGFGYGSQATTADETEGGSPGQPSLEPLRSRSELSHGSRNTTRENSRTGNPDQQAMGNDHSVQPMDIEKEVGLEVGSRRNSTDNIDIGEAHRDEREGCGENGGGLGTRQGELLGMAWVDSWKYATTEPDTESDPSRAG